MAWFGPKGVATMTFALFVLGSEVPEGERIANIAALTVFVSIIAHGLTDHPAARVDGAARETQKTSDAPRPIRVVRCHAQPLAGGVGENSTGGFSCIVSRSRVGVIAITDAPLFFSLCRWSPPVRCRAVPAGRGRRHRDSRTSLAQLPVAARAPARRPLRSRRPHRRPRRAAGARRPASAAPAPAPPPRPARVRAPAPAAPPRRRAGAPPAERRSRRLGAEHATQLADVGRKAGRSQVGATSAGRELAAAVGMTRPADQADAAAGVPDRA